MTNIFNMFSNRENNGKVLNETPHFQAQHVRYYTRTMDSGILEFWAHPVAEYEDYKGHNGRGVEKYYTQIEKATYLGKCVKDELIKAEDFYSLNMNLQRGALRLFREVGIYKSIEEGDF